MCFSFILNFMNLSGIEAVLDPLRYLPCKQDGFGSQLALTLLGCIKAMLNNSVRPDEFHFEGLFLNFFFSFSTEENILSTIKMPSIPSSNVCDLIPKKSKLWLQNCWGQFVCCPRGIKVSSMRSPIIKNSPGNVGDFK